MVLKDCEYDAAKVVTQLSSLAWFIRKHAIKDATKAGDKKCAAVYNALLNDLEVHLKILHSISRR